MIHGVPLCQWLLLAAIVGLSALVGLLEAQTARRWAGIEHELRDLLRKFPAKPPGAPGK